MRYFSFNDYKTAGAIDPYVATVSEDDIRRDYYPYWHERMCNRFGKEHVEKTYCFEDCLYDWIVATRAWESKE
jgi:hypothetical protein